MKWLYLIVGIVIVSIVVFFIKNKNPTETKTINISGNKARVEIADNPASQSKGLMFRKSMPKNHGMLFVFKNKGRHPIWMQNTYIPLDIIWLNENKEVIHIEKNVPPCKTVSCKTYGPKKPESLYFIEFNAGWVDAHNVKLTDIVDIM